MHIKRKYLLTTLFFASTAFSYAHAEKDIIKKGQLDSELLAPFSLKFGGQLRPEWTFKSGGEQPYEHNVHDGASRLRLTANYDVTPETKLLGYYELGINVPKILDWEDHYAPNAKSHQQRQAYIGVDDKTYGKLTYGQQFGLQYTVIGSKSDVWDNDGMAGASGVGINGAYDGGGRPKSSLMYSKDIDKFKVYANLLLPESPISTTLDQVKYKRENGAGLGFDYLLNKDITLSAAYSTTKAKVYNDSSEKQLRQNIFGSAITFKPNNWYMVGTASYYQDFIPAVKNQTLQNFFVGDGYGLEGFIGYTFKFDRPFFKEIQPYIAADTLRLKSGQENHLNHQFIGLATLVTKNLRVYAEYTFVDASDKSLKDTTYVTMFYSF